MHGSPVVRAVRQAAAVAELGAIRALRMDEPAKLADTIAANLQLSIEEKQQLLEVFDPEERLSASPTCSISRSRS